MPDEAIVRNVDFVVGLLETLGKDSIRKRSFIKQASLAMPGMPGSLLLHRSLYERPSIRAVPPSATIAPPLHLQANAQAATTQ